MSTLTDAIQGRVKWFLVGGGEIINLGPLPFGGPLKNCFPETK